MEKTEFERLVHETGLQERAIRLALRVLVDGEKPADVAQSEDVSRQLVEQAVRRVQRQQQITNGIPDNWVRVSVSLPPELADSVLWIYQQARLDAGLLVDAERMPPHLSAAGVELITDLIAGRRRKN